MEIRRDSWHYRLYRAGSDRFPPPETNLCRYFWRVVWGATAVTLVCSMVGVILAVVGFAVYEHPLASLTVVGTVAAIVGAALLFVHLRERLEDRRWAAGHAEPRPPGLLRAYLKAKKDEVCPLITFVDGIED